MVFFFSVVICLVSLSQLEAQVAALTSELAQSHTTAAAAVAAATSSHAPSHVRPHVMAAEANEAPRRTSVEDEHRVEQVCHGHVLRFFYWLKKK